MRTKILILLLFFVVSIAFSCNNSEKSKASEQKSAFDELIEAEAKLYEDPHNINTEEALALVDKYLEFADEYFFSDQAPEYLFKAAELAMNFNEPKLSISCLTQIEENYKDFDKYATSIFLKAFIYENYFDNQGMARSYYKKFISEFPDHKLKPDAENNLMFLGVSNDELIELFEKMN
ncbi:hypothetical protein LJC11_04480 [Bacteroidales bacterium OttesenSCG-928-I21]|nr:hypothetical protein [Bacteroidales bacterium OttesenSCG-928-I21]